MRALLHFIPLAFLTAMLDIGMALHSTSNSTQDSDPAGVIELENCRVLHATRKTGKRNAFEIVTAERYVVGDETRRTRRIADV